MKYLNALRVSKIEDQALDVFRAQAHGRIKTRHRYLFAVILAVQVCGCTVIPEQLSPYALSTAEMNVVIRGLYAGVKDLDSPNLRGLKAGRSSNGTYGSAAG
jgi:hypothetical protein